MKKYLLLILTVMLVIVSSVGLSACGGADFDISFIVDNEVYATVSTGGGETISMPQNPTKEDYTFDGWYWDNGVWQKPFTANSLLDAPLSSDMSVYAKFNINHPHNFNQQNTDEKYLCSSATCTHKAEYYYSCSCGEIGTETFEYGEKLNHQVKDGVCTVCENIVEYIEKVEGGYYVKLFNQTSYCDFSDKIQTEGDVQFQIYRTNNQGSLSNPVANNFVTNISVGTNIYYIGFTDGNIATLTIYRRHIYIVDFSTNGGTVVNSQRVEEDCKVTKPTDVMIKSGYVFQNWDFDFDTRLTSNQTINAVWKANDIKYTVNYYLENYEDDEYTLTHTDTLSSACDSTVTANLTNLSFVDYTKLEHNGANVSTRVTADGNAKIDVYFKYKRFNVTFELNGGTRTGGGALTQTIKYGYPATAPIFEKVGYTFVELDKDFDEIFEDKTITAKWVYYTLTTSINNENAGTITKYNETKITVDNSITITAKTNNGYTFIGWYNGDNLITSDLSYTFTMPSENLTYTAKWNINTYNISYELNGGELEQQNPTTYTIEDEIVLNIPTKTGYTFTWDNNGKIAKGSTGDKTFTANRQAIKYNITYELNGGVNNTSNPTTYTVEDEITLQELTKITKVEIKSQTSKGNGNYEITKEVTQYTFLGWYSENTFINKIETITTGSTGNLTLYAKWSESTTTTTTTEQAYKREGSYIYFGSYPQTDVTSSMGTTLSSYVGSKPTNGNNNGWTSYEYYIKGSNSTDFMWYKDIEYTDGNKYRAVYFTSYRPYYCNYSSSTDYTYQDDNGYYTSTVYWFRFDEIKWRILSEANGKAIILAELILDSQQYDYDGSYSNNYANSTIRAWLNDSFYNTAFTELQKAIINTVTVDNSARSTNPDNNATYWNSGVNNYACEDTQDKVWLLSEQEVTRASYGFSTSTGEDTARQKKTSEYSQCMGCYTHSGGSCDGNGYWWLRSPCYGNVSFSCCVNYNGYSSNCRDVNCTYCGVVPALQISLG